MRKDNKERKPTKKEALLLEAESVYGHLSLSELHEESIRIAKKCIDEYPLSWKDSIKGNTLHKGLIQLIKQRRHV